MNAKTRTTAALIGAAGTVVVTALVLEHTRAEGGATPMREAELPSACGPAGVASADAKLDRGTLHAAMVAGTVVKGAGDVQAAFELATDQVADAQRPALDLAFVIDHSGSMSGGRLDHAKSAARGIVDHLGTQDHVALIQYDDTAEVVVGSIAMDAGGKARLKKAIDGLVEAGGTNLNAGLVLGRQEVERVYTTGQVSRVILLSDGRANVGITATPQIAETARDAANHGVRITSVGIGTDFNEDLMEAIAESGRGNYHYVKEAHDLDAVIAGELAGVQATVATGVELRLRPACANAKIVAVHGYESRTEGAETVIPMADLFGGDRRRLLVSMRLPTAQVGRVGALHAELVYRDAKGGEIKRHAIDLGVDVSTDVARANASVDQNVMAQVLELQAAESMRSAAQAYESGDSAGAAQILDQSARDIQAKSAHYKIAPAKTAPALEGLGDMSKKAKMLKPGSYEGNDMLKASKQKARIMSKKGSF